MYREVSIQRLDATSPNSMPNPSTRNAIERFGRICQRVYSICIPPNIVGSIETTRPNFMKPAANVALSRRFGVFLSRRIGSTAANEARQASRGVMLVIAGVILAYAGYQVEGF